jgi:hypothetical protein
MNMAKKSLWQRDIDPCYPHVRFPLDLNRDKTETLEKVERALTEIPLKPPQDLEQGYNKGSDLHAWASRGDVDYP